ncbi:MAG: hypothetical protein JWP25_9033 [Bradyrhizobium sp.]|nr:hypothetical protein [Bradyrhizobium sp.]
MKAAVHYSPEVADKILGRMIAGLSVTRIARQPGMPTKAAIMKWVETKPEFREVYLRAQEGRGCTYAEKAVEAEYELNDIIRMMLTKQILPSVGRAIISAVQAKIDVFKWGAGRMAPKIFGERVTADHTVNVTGQVEFTARDALAHQIDRVADAESEAERPLVTH